MAELTTVDNAKLFFNPARVFAVADRDDAGNTVTSVYGLSSGIAHIAEPAGEFLKRIGVAPKFVKLTRPNDTPVWIKAAAVTLIAPPLRESLPNVKSRLFVGNFAQAVRETPKEVKTAFEKVGVNI